MKEDLFDKIEAKTNIKKETIMNLAKRLQEGNFKDENTLRDIIHEISDLTGKEVSEEKENKIIDMIKKDKVSLDVDDYKL